MELEYGDIYYSEFINTLTEIITEMIGEEVWIDEYFPDVESNTAEIDYVIIGSTTWRDDAWYSKDDERRYFTEIDAGLYSLEDVLCKVNSYIEEDYEKSIDMNEVKKHIQKKYNGSNYFILVHEWDCDGQMEFFDDLEEAEAEIKELENSEKPYVEDYIENFEKMVDERVKHSFVDARYNRANKDFQVYMDDMLIIDNAQRLDENEVDEFVSFVNFKNEIEDEYGIYITECQKYKHDIGFTRGYTIRFEKDGASVERDIELTGYNSLLFAQGNKRNAQSIIEQTIDIDDILEELEEEIEEEAQYER